MTRTEAPARVLDDAELRRLQGSIAESIEQGRLREVPGVEGLSGDSLVGLLQRVARQRCRRGTTCYVEVGVFRGLTLASVASVVDGARVFGIDNYSQFDPAGHNKGIVERALSAHGLANALLLDLDFEEALQTLGGHLGGERIGLYFVDGPHDYRSQRVCLDLVLPHLADDAVIIVDDSNYAHVRQANRDFLLAQPAFKLLYEAYTPAHPENLAPDERARLSRGWWNGVNVMIRDPDDRLPRMYPPAAERELFLNEHLVHANRLGLAAADAVSFADALTSFRLVRAAALLLRLVRTAGARRRGAWSDRNTHSDTLVAQRWNPGLTPPTRSA